MTAGLKIEMPGVDFTKMAEDAIAAKITEALLGAEAISGKIVAAAMNTKVNGQGYVDKSSYENKTPFIQWLAEDMIRKVTKDVLSTKVEELRPLLAKQVESELRRNTKSIAVALTDDFLRIAKNGYGVTINMTAEVRRHD